MRKRVGLYWTAASLPPSQAYGATGCEAEGVATRGALPRLRGRGEQGGIASQTHIVSALYIVAWFRGFIAPNLRRLNRTHLRAPVDEGRATPVSPLTIGLASEAALHGRRPFGLATRRAVGLAKAEARQRSTARLLGLKPGLKPSILGVYCIRPLGKGKRFGMRSPA